MNNWVKMITAIKDYQRNSYPSTWINTFSLCIQYRYKSMVIKMPEDF
jgi:hypothetical protein